MSIWIDSFQNQKYIDTITHYCRAEINRGNARFFIYANEENIGKNAEERKEEKYGTLKKEGQAVPIGRMNK